MASQARFWQETEDWHTAGEPFRIVEQLPENTLQPGLSVSEQRLHILRTPGHPLDTLRRTLCHEPRGHADMYGGFITPPNDPGAHFGVMFWHKDGFSTACGHGTIALGYWAVSKGMVQLPQGDGEIEVVIDVPSGRVKALAHYRNSKVQHVDFVNVASYQVAKRMPANVQLDTEAVELEMDFTFGGAIYACVDVANLGLEVEPGNYQRFIDLQRQIKCQYAEFQYLDVYDIYGVCFFQHMRDEPSDGQITQKNVVVFADGQIDRSPCGSGTAARVAVLFAEGRLQGSKKLGHYSLIGTLFEAGISSLPFEDSELPATVQGGEFPVCVPYVRGTANLVGRMNFYIDPSDSIYPGFILR
ncbi:Diaminopimelate epimerase-like protein [Polychaeton citri CBS 116435]|uniref:trans-L-3-hydroxyproline dehydratase n=1 Tax=Polychaeton citri CBS 116435 TaxID=1314669 RepID=A0A9P4Q8D8_9PEZI|nr:Diaminopimelate epimerase-like protein [Polychaeton citri CBS 116435]